MDTLATHNPNAPSHRTKLASRRHRPPRAGTGTIRLESNAFGPGCRIAYRALTLAGFHRLSPASRLRLPRRSEFEHRRGALGQALRQPRPLYATGPAVVQRAAWLPRGCRRSQLAVDDAAPVRALEHRRLAHPVRRQRAFQRLGLNRRPGLAPRCDSDSVNGSSPTITAIFPCVSTSPSHPTLQGTVCGFGCALNAFRYHPVNASSPGEHTATGDVNIVSVRSRLERAMIVLERVLAS